MYHAGCYFGFYPVDSDILTKATQECECVYVLMLTSHPELRGVQQAWKEVQEEIAHYSNAIPRLVDISDIPRQPGFTSEFLEAMEPHIFNACNGLVDEIYYYEKEDENI